ncbi:FtsK/SpoIIIE domain-containing protein [Pseudonocardia benzenivorans]
MHAPVGFAEGLRKDLVLADGSPHALIGGPSGTGKTNLLLTMIGSMAARYSPHELEFYLLDFKEGVSFAQFAPGRRDTTWLPHARLVGVNVNTDREFGLALLRFLSDEMRRRADAAKEHEVTKLEELRHRDPHGHWPRIVAVIDEFQYLFAERDDVTRAATQLLEDVARRGRSQGIHLVLASQDVSGIEAFWGRPAIFEQFVLRVALPRARRVLADLNDAALDLPRWHAVLNHESGIKHGNEIVRIPDAAQSTLALLQQRLHDDHAAAFAPPVLFDGARAPRYADLADRLPAAGGGATPRALVGQVIDVAASPATVALPDAPARNIAVLGAGASDALAVLAAATGRCATSTRRGGRRRAGAARRRGRGVRAADGRPVGGARRHDRRARRDPRARRDARGRRDGPALRRPTPPRPPRPPRWRRRRPRPRPAGDRGAAAHPALRPGDGRARAGVVAQRRAASDTAHPRRRSRRHRRLGGARRAGQRARAARAGAAAVGAAARPRPVLRPRAARPAAGRPGAGAGAGPGITIRCRGRGAAVGCGGRGAAAECAR